MRWMIWGWALLAVLATLLVTLSGTAVVAQDDDDEESEIEIESGPDPEEEPEARPDGKKSERRADGTIPGRAPGTKVKWRAYSDKRKQIEFPVPEDWEIKQVIDDPKSAGFDLRVPGGSRTLPRLTLRYQAENIHPPHSTPHLYRNQASKTRRDTKFEIAGEPVPHVIESERQGDLDTVSIRCFLRQRGRSLTATLSLAAQDRPMVEADFFKLLKGLKVKLLQWPEIPKNYKAKTKSGFRIAVHSKVSSPTKEQLKIALTAQKRFTKFHGKAPRWHGDEPPITIFIHPAHTMVLETFPSLKESKNRDVFDVSGLRIFTLTMAGKGDPNDRAQLANLVTRACFVRRYGHALPRWAEIGEASLAGAAMFSDVKMPKLHIGLQAWEQEAGTPRLTEMTRESAAANGQLFSRRAFIYALFFHYGPAKYRKAYKKFLAEISKTCDPVAAQKKHLESLDYSRIVIDLRNFLARKVEYVTPK